MNESNSAAHVRSGDWLVRARALGGRGRARRPASRGARARERDASRRAGASSSRREPRALRDPRRDQSRTVSACPPSFDVASRRVLWPSRLWADSPREPVLPVPRSARARAGPSPSPSQLGSPAGPPSYRFHRQPVCSSALEAMGNSRSRPSDAPAPSPTPLQGAATHDVEAQAPAAARPTTATVRGARGDARNARLRDLASLRFLGTAARPSSGDAVASVLTLAPRVGSRPGRLPAPRPALPARRPPSCSARVGRAQLSVDACRRPPAHLFPVDRAGRGRRWRSHQRAVVQPAAPALSRQGAMRRTAGDPAGLCTGRHRGRGRRRVDVAPWVALVLPRAAKRAARFDRSMYQRRDFSR